MKHIRDPKVKSNLKKIGKAIVTSKDARIYILKAFETKNLIVLGETTQLAGLFSIGYLNSKEEYRYVTIRAMAMFTIEYDTLGEELIDDKEYYYFDIPKNTPVITSNTILQQGSLSYNSLYMLSFYARIPFYMSYKEADMAEYYLTSTQMTGVTIDSSVGTMFLVSSIQARLDTDREKSIRHVKSFKEEDIFYAPLVNHLTGATQNFNRLTNSYQAEGLLAATVKDKQENATLVESIARS